RVRAEEPSPYSHLVDWGSRQLIETFSPETKRYAGRLVAEIAAEEGADPFELLMDIVVADELKTTFSTRAFAPRRGDWEARAAVRWIRGSTSRAVPGDSTVRPTVSSTCWSTACPWPKTAPSPAPSPVACFDRDRTRRHPR